MSQTTSSKSNPAETTKLYEEFNKTFNNSIFCGKITGDEFKKLIPHVATCLARRNHRQSQLLMKANQSIAELSEEIKTLTLENTKLKRCIAKITTAIEELS